MALTRIAVESAMAGSGRLKEILQTLKRSTVTDGTNADLNEPMASALEEFGVLPADRAAVADADLAKLDDTLQARYLDLVELRALEQFSNALAIQARVQQWEDYKIDRTDQTEWLIQLLNLKRQQFERRHQQPPAPASVEMDAGICHKLRLPRARTAAGLPSIDDL